MAEEIEEVTEVNRDNVQKLIDFISESKSFDQNKFFHMKPEGRHPCRTPACIAGHLLDMAREEGYEFESYSLSSSRDVILSESHAAQEYAGLSDSQREAMFFEGHVYKHKDDAIKMLEHFLKTGEIVWDPEKVEV